MVRRRLSGESSPPPSSTDLRFFAVTAFAAFTSSALMSASVALCALALAAPSTGEVVGVGSAVDAVDSSDGDCDSSSSSILATLRRIDFSSVSSPPLSSRAASLCEPLRRRLEEEEEEDEDVATGGRCRWCEGPERLRGCEDVAEEDVASSFSALCTLSSSCESSLAAGSSGWKVCACGSSRSVQEDGKCVGVDGDDSGVSTREADEDRCAG